MPLNCDLRPRVIKKKLKTNSILYKNKFNLILDIKRVFYNTYSMATIVAARLDTYIALSGIHEVNFILKNYFNAIKISKLFFNYF